ncbi:MAG: DUF5916 domain-containing protein [Luteimonas sp.]
MRSLLLAGALLLAHASAAVHAAEPLQVPRIDGDIVVDGKLDEAVWTQTATVDLAYETQPGDNLAASVKTTARIAYSNDAVLIAFRAEDPDPTKIRAFLRDRDALYSDDFLGVVLDTFDDQRRAYEFFVNPLGVQADLIKEEAGNEDDSWDGLWTSAARITDTGYDVEMRIPFATLRFKDTDGVRRWGASFLRIRPRQYRYQYANQRIERGNRCYLCTFDKIEGFTGVRQGRNLEIAPTLTVIHAEERSGPGAPWQGEGTDIEPGLDVSWAPSPNLTVNGTINPDFSQVESDQAQLDLNTSFALFFPEKRPFFLEGADYFNTPLSVLYTRQIADPDFGLRVTGRSGKQAYGAIVARDATTQLLVPGVLGSGFRFLDQEADVLVGRYRYDLDKSTTLGAIATYRRGDGYDNGLAGLDGRWQKGVHTLRGQWLRSESNYPAGIGIADTAPQGDALFVHYNIGNRNWSGNVSHTAIDPGFRADLGFISQVGFERSLIGGGHTWFGKEGARISRVSLRGDWDITHRYDGQLLEREVEAYLGISAARETNGNVGGVTRVRFWNGQLFDETFYTLSAQTTVRPGFKAGMFYRTGDQLDLAASRMGRITDWQPWLEMDIGRGINLNVNYTHQRLRRDGGTVFDAKVIDGRLSWQLDPRQRVRLSLQGSDVARDQALHTRPVNLRARDLASQLLYSYKLNPRSALYAGYSQGGYSDDLQNNLFANSRNVFLKLSYAWQPQF